MKYMEDKNTGNKVCLDKFNKVQAKKILEQMNKNDCIDCLNCINCKNCYRCLDCINCSNLENAKNRINVYYHGILKYYKV